MAVKRLDRTHAAVIRKLLHVIHANLLLLSCKKRHERTYRMLRSNVKIFICNAILPAGLFTRVWKQIGECNFKFNSLTPQVSVYI